MDNIGVPVLSAGYGYVGSKMLLGNTGNVTVGGTSVDKNIAVAGLVGAGALISQLSKDYIIPRIPGDQRVKNIAKNAVGPAVCGLATFGIEKALLSENSAVTSLLGGSSNASSSLANAALGAGSYIAGQYTYDMVYGK